MANEIVVGAERTLGFGDVYPLPSEDAPNRLVKRLKHEWNRVKDRGPSSWYLVLAIWRVVGRKYSIGFLPLYLWLAFSMVQPYVASRLINFAGDPDASIWYGLGLVACDLVAGTMCLFGLRHYFYNAERMGLRVRTMLSGLVYRKSLRVPNVSRGTASNLMNLDPWKVSEIRETINNLAYMPMQVIITVVMLYWWLGLAGFTPLVVLIAFIPVNYFMVGQFGQIGEMIMITKDKRINKLTEILQGILVVKLFSWEKSIAARIDKVRAKEVVQLRRFAYCLAKFMFFVLSLSSVVAASTFTVYVLLGHKLTADVIFPSLTLFNYLTWPILKLPEIVSKFSESRISILRLNKFLRREELPPVKLKTPDSLNGEDEDVVLSMKDAEFEWLVDEDPEEDEDEDSKDKKDKKKKSSVDEVELEGFEMIGIPGTSEGSNSSSKSESGKQLEKEKEQKLAFKLKGLNCEVKRGQLIAIIGRVGSGKSSMLSAMLGEMKQTQGEMWMTASQKGRGVSYVGQKAWICNASVRDNILFYNEYDQAKYRQVVKKCALQEDLKILPAGDKTEIGERGVNISGGQKQRVSLARACYADEDIVLLDDPLSAVDAHVGQLLFRQCICGLLKEKTRVLVTHQLQFLNAVDEIWVMHDGAIQQRGSYEELVASGFDFASMLQKQEQAGSSEDGKGKQVAEDWKKASVDGTSDWKTASVDGTQAGSGTNPSNEASGKIIDEEERNVGAVAWSVYAKYFLTVGGPAFLTFMALVSIMLESSYQGSSLWLAHWTESDPEKTNHSINLAVYVGISLGGCVCAFIRQFSWFGSTLAAARRIHDMLLRAILRAPMSFFHSTPTGRIVNRFSRDQELVDTWLSDQISDFFLCSLSSLALTLMISIISPWFLLMVVPLFYVYYKVQQYYRQTSRELGRLQSISNSPIYAHYSESLDGSDTIRAFKRQRDLVSKNEQLVGLNAGVSLCLEATQSWLGMRIEAIATAVLVTVGLLVVLTRGLLPLSLVGILLLAASSLTGNLNWMVRSMTMVETSMNNVERIFRYMDTEPEARLFTDLSEDKQLTRNAQEHEESGQWMDQGKIELRDVWMRYRANLEPVLRGVSLSINAGEKIGVVGRTGAGKSSLINALFRLVEVEQGTISIDGVDISQLGLAQLRSQLAIIPQDPVLFSGTIRSNLDPFDNYRDSELWKALGRVKLKEVVSKMEGQLEGKVRNNGSNLSVGQRQLVCMARALLKESKVLVMDEATASVDNETDGLIQHTLREEFGKRTIVIIAHRLHTIMQCDKVLVMHQGTVVEFDSPTRLLDIEGGWLSKLVDDTGPTAAAHLRAMANAIEPVATSSA